MGGRGSGRKPADGRKRRLVGDTPSIVITELVGPQAPASGAPLFRSWTQAGSRTRAEILPAREFSFVCLVSVVTAAGEKRAAEEQLQLVQLPRRLGGTETRFECPDRTCRKAVRQLYVDELRLRCRSCAGLVYESQRQTAATRRRNRLAELEAQLVGPSGRLRRPAGMRRKRYEQLGDELYALRRLVLADEAKLRNKLAASAERTLEALMRGERIRLKESDPFEFDLPPGGTLAAELGSMLEETGAGRNPKPAEGTA